MELIPMFLDEMEQEAQTTRNMLQRIPDDKYDWNPHEKSMTVRSLATHIANLPMLDMPIMGSYGPSANAQ